MQLRRTKAKYTLTIETNDPADIIMHLQIANPQIPDDMDLDKEIDAILEETIEPDPIKTEPIKPAVSLEDLQLLCKTLAKKRGSRTPVNTIIQAHGFEAVADITPELSGVIAEELQEAINA